MKQRGRKLLVLALCLALCAGLLTGTALAAETVDSGTCGADGDNLTWTLNSDLMLTISGTGAMADYGYGEAPWYSWNGGPVRQAVIRSGVTSIGSYAFSGCSSLTSVTIPNSVTSIGYGTFEGCSSLTSITIPDSVTSIGGLAYYYCSGLTSIAIPVGVTSIGNGTFYNCSSLTSVSIPDSVTNIGYGAFYGCSSLTSVSIPDSVTSIDSNAFENCSNLMSITIPDSVTSIGYGAFYGCSSLTSVSIPDSVTSIGGSMFEGCRSLTGITIPDSVTYIGSNAFSGCGSLTEVVLPGSLRSIGEYAFQNCSSLKRITIPAATSTLAGHAFDGCGSLTYVSILGSRLSTIGDYCFLNCSALKNVFIPASVTTVETGAFRYCDALADVYYAGDEEAWNGITIRSYNEPLTGGNLHFGAEPVSLLSNPANVTVTAGSQATFRVTATGATGYQWQASTDGGKTWVNSGASGSKTAILSFTASTAHNGYLFRCVLTGAGMTVTTGAAKLTVTAAVGPKITAQPASTSVTAGSPATFRVTATGATGYQWQASTDGGKTWKNSSAGGNQTATLSFTAAAAHNGYLFRCVVKGSGGNTVSNAAMLTVTAAGPSITAQPASTSVTAGSTATFQVTATGATGYQWQASTDGGRTWKNSSAGGNQTATLSFTAATAHNGYMFRCIVKGSGGNTVSNAAMLTVTAAGPSITGQPISLSVTAGSTATFRVTASGATGYQWQASTDGGKTWVNSGANGNKTATLSFTTATAHNGYMFRCIVKGSGGNTVSNAATLTVTAPALTITAQPEDVSVTAGSTAIFRVTATGATGYQWQVSTNGGASWVNSGANGNKTATLSFTAAAAHNGYMFRCVVSGGGKTAISDAAMLSVSASGTCGANGDNLTWVLNGGGVLIISGEGEMGNYTYSTHAPWYDIRNEIRQLVIGEGVTSIGSYAFMGCYNMTSIAIPDSVTRIGEDAFSYCRRLTSIAIPDEVSSIGSYAFLYCSRLTNIQVSAGNAAYSSRDGVLFNKDQTTLITCPGGIAGRYTIPESVTRVGDYAFMSCYDLTSVMIPDGVSGISRNAFLYCQGLTEIQVSAGNSVYSSRDGVLFNKDQTELLLCPEKKAVDYLIPEGVTRIGDYAFDSNDNLTSIVIPEGVTSIGDWVFCNCSNLTSVTIPASMTSVGRQAFDYCYDLTDVYYGGTLEEWQSISIGSSNDPLLNAAIHTTEPSEPENGASGG